MPSSARTLRKLSAQNARSAALQLRLSCWQHLQAVQVVCKNLDESSCFYHAFTQDELRMVNAIKYV